MFLSTFFECLGGRLFRNVISTATFFLVIFVFNTFSIKIDYSSLNIWIIFYLPLLFVLNFVRSLFITNIAFFIRDKRDLSSLCEDIGSTVNIFSSLMIPIDKIPIIGSVLIYAPFSLFFYHSTRIFLNHYNLYQTSIVYLCAFVWLAFILSLGLLLHKADLKKNEAVGL